MNNEKSLLRHLLIKRRGEIENCRVLEAKEELKHKLTKHYLFNSSENVFLYASYGSELSTFELIDYSLREGKKVYLPKVVDQNLAFFKISNVYKDIKPGYKSIPEPVEGLEEYCITPQNVELCLLIIPGVGFDKDGNRMGYGGGFYDRFLAKNPLIIPRSIAIGFKEQLCNSIPTENTDIKPGEILLV